MSTSSILYSLYRSILLAILRGSVAHVSDRETVERNAVPCFHAFAIRTCRWRTIGLDIPPVSSRAYASTF